MSRQNQGRTFFGTNGVPSAINVTFGNTSPTLDALPLPATAGDIRFLTDEANPNNLKWVCTVSGTPGTWVLVSVGGSGTLLQFESINLVGTQLDAFVTTGLEQGQTAYVGNDTFAGQHSVQDFFVLVYGEALTPDGLTVVNSPTFGVDGAQWKRQQTHNPANQTRLFWCVDPLNTSGVAHDENSGWGATQAAARTNPLRTIEELNRRMVGVVLDGVGGDVVFEQYSSFTGGNNGQLTNLRTTRFGYPVWVGFRTQLFTGVISAYFAINTAANTRTTLTAPAGISGNVGKLIMNAAGTKVAWITKDVASGVVGLTPPTTGLAYPYTLGGATEFTIGETVNVYDVPILYDYPFPQSILYPGLQWVDRVGNAAEMAGSLVTIAATRFVDAIANHPSSGNVMGCLFVGDNYILGADNLALAFCGILNGTLICQQGVLGIAHSKLDLQNSRLLIAGATFAGTTTDTGIGVFECAGATGALVLQRGVGGRFQFPSTGEIYGQGNTAHILTIAVGTQSTVPLAATCTATTTAAKPLLVEGVEYDYVDMPIATANLTGLNNVDA